jgi:hypothetical protein
MVVAGVTGDRVRCDWRCRLDVVGLTLTVSALLGPLLFDTICSVLCALLLGT